MLAIYPMKVYDELTLHQFKITIQSNAHYQLALLFFIIHF